MEKEREFEETVTRAEASTALRGVADGVDAGSIRFDLDDEPVDVPVPEEFELEIEHEHEEGTIEVEIELEWKSTEDEIRDHDSAGESAVELEDMDRKGDVEGGTGGVNSGSGGVGADTGDVESQRDAERPLVSAATATESLARFEIFRDKADEWRWRLVHRNGNIIATSGEGYTQKHNAKKGLQSVVTNAPEAVIEDEAGFE